MVMLSKYTKGGITLNELQAMPLEDYLMLSKAIRELIDLEEQEIEKASKGWKR